MIAVDGRAKTGIIAGIAKSGPNLFHKDIYGYSTFNEIVDACYSSWQKTRLRSIGALLVITKVLSSVLTVG